MSYTLRDYQEKAVSIAVQNLLKGKRRFVIGAATGAGKSVMIAELARRCRELRPHKKILILHHKASLAKQNHAKITAIAPELNATIWSAQLKQKIDGDIVFGTIGSIVNAQFENIGLIIVDECHRINSEKGQFIETLRAYKVPTVGFTATPWRLASGLIYGTTKFFSELSYNVSMQFLTERGYLVPMVLPDFPITAIDYSKVKITAGEYSISDMEKACESEFERIIPEMLEYTKDRRSILIFCPSVDSAIEVSDKLVELGHISYSVYEKTKQKEREAICKSVSDGSTRFVTSVETMTTGIDIPEVDCVVFFRSTQSSALYVQMAGRGSRLAPWTGKKDCLLVDFTGVTGAHGLPAEVIPSRERKKSEKDNIEEDKVCPQCWQLTPIDQLLCIHCGAEIQDINELNEVREKNVREIVTHEVATKYGTQKGTSHIDVGAISIKEKQFKDGSDGFVAEILPVKGGKIQVYMPTNHKKDWARSRALSTLRILRAIDGLEFIPCAHMTYDREAGFWSFHGWDIEQIKEHLIKKKLAEYS